jgi:hypothetical protein
MIPTALRHQEIQDQLRYPIDDPCRFGVGQNEWRQQTYSPTGGYVYQQSTLKSAIHELGAGEVQFDADHQATAPNFDNARVVAESFPDVRGHCGSKLAGPRD